MKTFYDYKKAVISNGSVKGIYKNKGGQYCHLTDNSDGLGGCWIECNPADHLETLEDFLTRGLRLVNGDKFTCPETGSVCIVGVETGESRVNERDHDDRHIYVVKAADYDTETPEEKEAFDAIPNQTTIDSMNSESEKESYNSASEAFDAIDTTPQQVESLGKAEWKNGDECVYDNRDAVFACHLPLSKGLCVVEYHGPTTACDVAHVNELTKPETPAEREERERLEAAYDLYSEELKVGYGTKPLGFDLWLNSAVVRGYLAIVDKTGYRNQ